MAETVAAGAASSARVEGLGAAVTSRLGHGIAVHKVVVSASVVIVGGELCARPVDVQVRL